MTIILDPEGNETSALFEIFSDWTGKSVLEIGSGDGRLTWRYADKVARVVGLEPDAEKYEAGMENRTREFEHVEFFNLGLDEFYKHVTLRERSDRRVSFSKLLRLFASLTVRAASTPVRDGRVTNGEKFDLALLSWSL